MKVLIVDDEPTVRASLKRAFISRGHEICEASDGLVGVTKWREWLPEVVLLDVLMPGLSGPAVLKEMGPQKKCKVLLMSAYSGDYDLDKVKAMGADLFLAKPFASIFAVVDLAEEVYGSKETISSS